MDSSKSTRLSYLLCAYLSSFVYQILKSPQTNYRLNLQESLNIGLNTSNINFELLRTRRITEQGQTLAGYIIVAFKDTLYVAFKGTSNDIERKANTTSSPALLIGNILRKVKFLRESTINNKTKLNQAKRDYEKVFQTHSGTTQSFVFTKIHTGLYYTYLRNKTQLHADLNDLLDTRKYTKIVFTGHSMGAWLAAFANIDISNFATGRNFTRETNAYSKTTKGTGAKLERELVYKHKNVIISTISICFSLPPFQNTASTAKAGISAIGQAVMGRFRRNEKQGKTESVANYLNFKPAIRRANFTNYRKRLNRQNTIGSGKNAQTILIKSNNLCRFARRSNIRIVQFNFAHDPVSNGKVRSHMGNFAGSSNCARTMYDIFTTTLAYNSRIKHEVNAIAGLQDYLNVKREANVPQIYRHSMLLYLLCLIISIYNTGGEHNTFSNQYSIDYLLNIARMPGTSLLKDSLNAYTEQSIIQYVYPLYSLANFQYAYFKFRTDASNPHRFIFAKSFNTNNVNENVFENALSSLNTNRSRHLQVILNKFKNIYNTRRLVNAMKPAPRRYFLEPFNTFLNTYTRSHNLKMTEIRPLFSKTLKGWAQNSITKSDKQKILNSTIKSVETLIR